MIVSIMIFFPQLRMNYCVSGQRIKESLLDNNAGKMCFFAALFSLLIQVSTLTLRDGTLIYTVLVNS